MKKLALLVVVLFITTSLIGCGKKKKEEAAFSEGLNGVVSENVVSVDQGAVAQQGAGEGVPVVVENVENAAAQPAAEAAGNPATDKPSAKQIQQALKNSGFYAGKVDGDIGPRTKKATEAFQSHSGLKADGKVGQKTWKALSAYLNKPAEVENPTADAQTTGQ